MPRIRLQDLPAKRSETDLVRACLQYLHTRGIYAWRNNSGATKLPAHNGKGRFIRFGLPGSADILGVLPGGRFFAVECKVGRNKPSDLQAAFLKEITDAGGLAIVAYTVDDVHEAINGGKGNG